MITPQADIDRALALEKLVPPEDMALYMECMNCKPMSKRSGDQEIRDGCILSLGVYYRCTKFQHLYSKLV